MSKKDPNPQRELILAVRAGDSGAVSRLLLEGADPTANHSAALAIAAREGSPLADLLAPFPHESGAASFALRELAAHGRLSAIEKLLAHAQGPLATQAALAEAVGAGHLSCVELLLPLPNARDQNLCLLGLAVRFGQLDCAMLLLPLIDPNPAHEGPIAQAMFQACAAGHFEIARELSQRCDLKACAATALMRCSCCHDQRLARLFLPHCVPLTVLAAADNALSHRARDPLAFLASQLPEPQFLSLWKRSLHHPWALDLLRPRRRSIAEREALGKTASAPARPKPLAL